MRGVECNFSCCRGSGCLDFCLGLLVGNMFWEVDWALVWGAGGISDFVPFHVLLVETGYE